MRQNQSTTGIKPGLDTFPATQARQNHQHSVISSRSGA